MKSNTKKLVNESIGDYTNTDINQKRDCISASNINEWGEEDFDEEDFDEEDFDEEDFDEEDFDEEDFDEEDLLNMSDVVYKIDKWMPEDIDIQDEYYDILDDETISNEERLRDLVEFFNTHADQDRLRYYLGNRSIEDVAKHIISNESFDSDVNESKKFDEMPNDKLRELINEDPSSQDGLIAKIELKRRNDVNGISEKYSTR